MFKQRTRSKHRVFSDRHYKALRVEFIAGALLLGTGGAALWYWLGTNSLLILIPASIVIITILLLEVVRQVSLISNYYHENNLKQMQSLQSIYSILRPRFPLPSMTGYAGNPDFCELVMREILSLSPANVLELGSGASTIVSGLALKKTGGKMISVEHLDEFYREMLQELENHGLSDVVELVLCPLREIELEDRTFNWYDLTSLKEFPLIDLLIIDGPPTSIQKGSRFPALPLLRDHLASGAVIYLDDGRRDAEKAVVDAWLSLYPDLDASFISTEKGAFRLSYNRVIRN
jgi:predicted O-methyltransferase YrrM